MRRNQVVFLLLVIIITTCLLVTQYRSVSNKQLKYILYWTDMFGQSDFNLGMGSKIFEHCAISNCYATNNRSYLPVDQFDAILFHGAEYSVDSYGKPENRSPNQYYVYSNQESPANTPRFANLSDFFNWTMTYRLDSDIVRPYGYLEKTKTTYVQPSTEEVERKPYKIAWMVSNCHTPSLRKLLYANINKYIKVDIYGSCGNRTCSKKDPEKCYKFLEQNYKFYLSLENSICQDYVTEKLYNVMKKNLVPIVYGGSDYSKIAPQKSVIDATNFRSAKELVDYIRALDENPEEYLKYFQWKKDYIVKTDNKLALCSLCKKLNEPIVHKSYSDVYEWWNSHSMCRYRNSLPKILLT